MEKLLGALKMMVEQEQWAEVKEIVKEWKVEYVNGEPIVRLGWQDLIDRFHKLAKITGTDKSSSYNFGITYTIYDGVIVELGTYDIGDWPRTTILKCKDEEDALEQTATKITEAEAEVMLRIPDHP